MFAPMSRLRRAGGSSEAPLVQVAHGAKLLIQVAHSAKWVLCSKFANVLDPVGTRAIPLSDQEVAVPPSPKGRDLS